MIHVMFAAALAVLPAKAIGAPGAQILIETRGKTYEEDFGVRSLTSRLPVDSHTRFEIGSITKQFTAAAILQLKEQGKLSLRDPLGKYIPQYAPGRDVTIEQLLRQVSGIPDYVGTKAFNALIVHRNGATVMTAPITFQHVLHYIATKPLEFRPGTRWEYSNTNYFFLGEIVQRVSGIPYESYIRNHIFTPAHMMDSTFMDDERTLSDVATGYAMSETTHQPVTASPMFGAGGDGAIVSTASDLARWDSALFNGKIITKADVALMTEPGPLPAGPDAHYAFGWMVDRFDGIERIDHNGGTLGFTSSNQIYPSMGVRIIVLTNAGYVQTSSIGALALTARYPQVKEAYNRPMPGEDPAAASTVRDLWSQLISGSLERSMYEPRLYDFLVAHRDDPKKWFGHLGPPTAFIYKGTIPVHGKGAVAGYRYRLLFANGGEGGIEFALNAQHRVTGVLFVNP